MKIHLRYGLSVMEIKLSQLENTRQIIQQALYQLLKEKVSTRFFFFLGTIYNIESTDIFIYSLDT